MTRAAILAATVVMLAASAAPALADRTGHAGVHAPRQLDSIHAEFTLPGGPWGQLRGALAGTPMFGRYVYEVTLPTSVCRTFFSLVARASSRYPTVGKKTVRLRKDDPLLTVRSESRRGAIRWWTGTRAGDAAAGGVQSMPATLRSKSRRWLIYDVRASHGSVPRDDDACTTRARKTAARTVRSVVKTLKLAPGRPVSSPPFASP